MLLLNTEHDYPTTLPTVLCGQGRGYPAQAGGDGAVLSGKVRQGVG